MKQSVLRITTSILILTLISSQANAQKYWQRYLQVLKRFSTSGSLSTLIWHMDKKDSLGVYGVFDSIYTYDANLNKTGTFKPLYNAAKKNNASWNSGGDFLNYVSEFSAVAFHNKLFGEDYISVTAGGGDVPYFRKRNAANNQYQAVPNLNVDVYNSNFRFYEWGTNVLLVGGFNNINNQRFDQVALWNPQTNTIAAVGNVTLGYGITNANIYNSSVSSIDSTVGILYSDANTGNSLVRILYKGQSSWATDYPTLPKSGFIQIEVADKDNIFALYQSPDASNRISEMYRLNKTASRWDKIMTFTNLSRFITPRIDKMVYGNGYLFAIGSFDSVNAVKSKTVIQYQLATGQVANVSPYDIGSSGCGNDNGRIFFIDNKLYGVVNDCLLFGAQSVYVLSDTFPKVLPVTIASFSGQKQAAYNSLTWTSSQEINTDYFKIERAIDGQTFSAIGTIIAVGNTNVQISYQFVDNSPIEGKNYYRLKMVDKDGQTAYSHIIQINRTENSTSTVVVYPNPTKDNITLQIQSTSQQKMHIDIINGNGKVVKALVINAVNGLNQQTVNVSSLQHGLYVVKIVSNNQTTISKFIKE